MFSFLCGCNMSSCLQDQQWSLYCCPLYLSRTTTGISRGAPPNPDRTPREFEMWAVFAFGLLLKWSLFWSCCYRGSQSKAVWVRRSGASPGRVHALHSWSSLVRQSCTFVYYRYIYLSRLICRVSVFECWRTEPILPLVWLSCVRTVIKVGTCLWITSNANCVIKWALHCAASWGVTILRPVTVHLTEIYHRSTWWQLFKLTEEWLDHKNHIPSRTVIPLEGGAEFA